MDTVTQVVAMVLATAYNTPMTYSACGDRWVFIALF